jgi:hypothetical protein
MYIVTKVALLEHKLDFILPSLDSHPLVSAGDCFQTPPPYQNVQMLKSPI